MRLKFNYHKGSSSFEVSIIKGWKIHIIASIGIIKTNTIHHGKSNNLLTGREINGMRLIIVVRFLEEADSYCFSQQCGQFNLNLNRVCIVSFQVHLFPQFWQIGTELPSFLIKINSQSKLRLVITVIYFHYITRPSLKILK